MQNRPLYARFSILTILVVFLTGISVGQNLQNPRLSGKKKLRATYSSEPVLKKSDRDWVSTRLEFMLGGGVSGFLGDLGGQDGVGKPFIYDYEPTLTRYSASVGARYFVREYHAIRTYLSYGEVKGSDALTTYPNRRFRNLNFKSPIIELAGIYEWHLFKPTYIHYMGANSTKLFSGNRFGLYLSGGVGLFYFNPKAKLGTQYYALKPLRTEGQGFEDGPKPYSRINLSIPFGGGVYMLLNHNFTVGLDFAMRWAATDYIDDASGYYYDNQKIAERDGKLAAYFANPSVALQDVPERNWYTKNQPRGGPGNDSYMFLQVTLSKSFAPSVSNREFKQKKKRKARAIPKRKFKKDKEGRKSKTYKSKGLKNNKRKFKAPNLQFKKSKQKKKKVSF